MIRKATYCKPQVTTLSARELVEEMGPAQAIVSGGQSAATQLQPRGAREHLGPSLPKR